MGDRHKNFEDSINWARYSFAKSVASFEGTMKSFGGMVF
jgi:hypothetical protein